MKEPRFSAPRGGVLRNSPHRLSTEGSVSPHRSKKLKKSAKTAEEEALAIARRDMRNRTIAGHGGNYGTAFLYAGDRFWEQVRALRNIKRAALDKRKLALGRRTLESVNWRTALPNPLPDRFVYAFVEAVRDRHFPKRRRKAQARFLGASLGADGEVSPRRSRDICGAERRRTKKTTPPAEFYIRCCGKKRWTVKQVCPECKSNPFEFPYFSASLGLSLG
jgi:hypothetical protein